MGHWQTLPCKAKTARKNGRPSWQNQRCQQGNAIGMQSAQLPWRKGCRLACLRKTFLPFGREGAGKGSSRPKATRVCPRKASLNKKGFTHSGRWLVQDVGVGTARARRSRRRRLLGQAPEHGSCVFSLQGHRQGLKQLLNALGRRQPDASSMQRPKLFPSGRSGGAPPTGGCRDIWGDERWKVARPCGAKPISKWKGTKHLSVGPLLEVEMLKKCTALWREAHFKVKSVKNWGSRSTFGSWDVEKVHAVVARSTFGSQRC